MLSEDTIIRPPWLKTRSTAEPDTKALKAWNADRNSLFSPTMLHCQNGRQSSSPSVHSLVFMSRWLVSCYSACTWLGLWLARSFSRFGGGTSSSSAGEVVLLENTCQEIINLNQNKRISLQCCLFSCVIFDNVAFWTASSIALSHNACC